MPNISTTDIEKAQEVYSKNYPMVTHFERAIFLSWYCSKGDCAFCYMSTQKDKIKDPSKARRTRESVLAEVAIGKVCGWGIEFLSGGYESYTIDELVSVVQDVRHMSGQRQWLNMGVLSVEEMEKFGDNIHGVCAAIECTNVELHDKLCPSKPIKPMVDMLKQAKGLGLKTAMTCIIGLGESIEDIDSLLDFIRENKVDRITFYALNPHEGTSFTRGPNSEYYSEWISRVRIEFPKLDIVAGSWVDRMDEIPLLLQAGANSITKFPAVKLFGSEQAQHMENGAAFAGRTFKGTMTKLPPIDEIYETIDSACAKSQQIASMKEGIIEKAERYYKVMKRKKM